jgi:hypothetical protein
MTNTRTRARCSRGDLRRVVPADVSRPKAKRQNFADSVRSSGQTEWKGVRKRCDEWEVYVLILKNQDKCKDG